jgi:hypothetical protein
MNIFGNFSFNYKAFISNYIHYSFLLFLNQDFMVSTNCSLISSSDFVKKESEMIYLVELDDASNFWPCSFG